ncbi:hypothetical protein GUJ93_ZPchr0012g19563 [Zizania palustris]|uniref:Uncharacterized protein n=1 Tax=Zizania palustris TaxID=103762 RepID=A0A8J6BTW6_ZIZPA|nr:hypothetical protein GUJ93_ZPchr0012g19563 [Zizania palustris]
MDYETVAAKRCFWRVLVAEKAGSPMVGPTAACAWLISTAGTLLHVASFFLCAGPPTTQLKTPVVANAQPRQLLFGWNQVVSGG